MYTNEVYEPYEPRYTGAKPEGVSPAPTRTKVHGRPRKGCLLVVCMILMVTVVGLVLASALQSAHFDTQQVGPRQAALLLSHQVWHWQLSSSTQTFDFYRRGAIVRLEVVSTRRTVHWLDYDQNLYYIIEGRRCYNASDTSLNAYYNWARDGTLEDLYFFTLSVPVHVTNAPREYLQMPLACPMASWSNAQPRTQIFQQTALFSNETYYQHAYTLEHYDRELQPLWQLDAAEQADLKALFPTRWLSTQDFVLQLSPAPRYVAEPAHSVGLRLLNDYICYSLRPWPRLYSLCIDMARCGRTWSRPSGCPSCACRCLYDFAATVALQGVLLCQRDLACLAAALVWRQVLLAQPCFERTLSKQQCWYVPLTTRTACKGQIFNSCKDLIDYAKVCPGDELDTCFVHTADFIHSQIDITDLL